MKYVALLSGGKDSCYNLLHCHKNGHKLVAAASLSPETGKEEIDSYLYQTVGQDAIEFVARALEVPLYRKIITGAAIEQGSEYGGRSAKDGGGIEGDETEDLYNLLFDVKSHHPDVLGVSVGAILSNYQRVRVEHVCRRLSLTPLCYLWQRDQAELLSEMIEAGMEAILIKVAGIGLTPMHLGKTLAEMQPTLVKLNTLYGSHICGEGGEYESLTLDCPLFKHRIVLTQTETVTHSDSGFATVAFLRIKGATLERKEENTTFDLQVPSLLTHEFEVISVPGHTSQVNSTNTMNGLSDFPLPSSSSGAGSRSLGSWVAVTNVHKKLVDTMGELSIEDEVSECFHQLQDCLAAHSLTLSHSANINIFLSSMDFFPRVNAVYAKFFGSSPPSRACVAVDLPAPLRVKLDCLAYAERVPSDRQALHVQSMSYWAPANIGPYSQAIMANERIFISGQIGLIPSSLALPSPPTIDLEIALCFQHAERVAVAFKATTGGWDGCTQAALFWLANSNDVELVKRAYKTYYKHCRVPALFLVVKSLPKGALVEKQDLLHSGRCLVEDEEGELTMEAQIPLVEAGDIHDQENMIRWEVSLFENTKSGGSCGVIFVKGDHTSMSSQLKMIPSLSPFWSRTLSIRLFYSPSSGNSWLSMIQSVFGSEVVPPITPIPCRLICSQDANNWDYALCIFGD